MLNRFAACSHGLWIFIQSALHHFERIDDPLPPKPKGMHWATYNRLVERHEELADRSFRVLDAWADELFAQERKRPKT